MTLPIAPMTFDQMTAQLSQEPIGQFFSFAHLPEHLQSASAPFAYLAAHVIATTPRNPERTVALRKLMEAKDAAVRAKVYRDR